MKAMVTLANRRRHNWFELNRIVGKQDAADTNYMATDCQIAVPTSKPMTEYQVDGKQATADTKHQVAGTPVAGSQYISNHINVINTQAIGDRTLGDSGALGYLSSAAGKTPAPVEAAPGYPLTYLEVNT